MEDWRHGGFGLYLHWPFCESKCPYCDFNSHVAGTIDQARWQRAYLAEIDRAGLETAGRTLTTVYFGGGTPSLMRPELVDAVLQRIRRTWPTANDLEVTLEANPRSVEAGRFRAYRSVGVSRVSMGMQALNDVDLRRLGRLHSAAEALDALATARACFDRVSFDLIYARQGQTLAQWGRELELALSFASDHLSLYQLTIEPGTAFGERFALGRLSDLPDEEVAADMYDLTQDLCDRHGLPAYEVSNHAAPGNESRHNLIYWRGGDYCGIGPGAHGRLTLQGHRLATETETAPLAWLQAVESCGSGERVRQALSSTEHGLEYLLMSMRLSEGLDCRRLAAITGTALSPEALEELVALEMVTLQGFRLTATRKGRAVLNSVIRKLAGA